MANFVLDLDFDANRFMMFELDQIANDMENNGIEVIRMTLGKSELPLHASIIDVMKQAMDDFSKSALVFPAGLPQLRKEIADKYNREYHKYIKDSNVIISVGTSTLFRNLFQLLIKKGDEVLLPLPYYSLYNFSALLVGANIKYYRIDTNTMELDRQSFMSNFSRNTKVVVINTPGNPLGNILTKEDLYYIDDIVNGRSVIINDEIYANICFDEKSTSILQLENTKSQFITINAFSKGYRMYSRRIGYTIVPDEFVEPLTVIQHHTLLTADPIPQFGAIEALRHEEEVQYLCNLYKQRRDYTLEKFSNHAYVKVLPSKGSFYISLDTEKYMEKHNFKTSSQLAKDIIQKTHVATVPGSDFGVPNMLRLSFSTKKYNEGIDRLHSYFNE